MQLLALPVLTKKLEIDLIYSLSKISSVYITIAPF